MRQNPYQAYQTTQVQTASTGEIVVLLYDGAVRFLNRGLLALDEGRSDTAHADIIRGQEIVLELMTGLDLDRGGDLASNLRDLYIYMYQTLVQANIRKDRELVVTVIRLLDELRAAWRTVVFGSVANPVAAEGRAA
jgi:flagellar secretion chaperone FliS